MSLALAAVTFAFLCLVIALVGALAIQSGLASFTGSLGL